MDPEGIEIVNTVAIAVAAYDLLAGVTGGVGGVILLLVVNAVLIRSWRRRN